ncbi:MAG: hypothetical protein RLN70_08795, partial [Rhodospirillaceae bacterium]
MNSTVGIVIDLGGVVYQGREVIPGSVEAVSRLKEAGIPYRFLTNTTSQPRSKVLEKLRCIGVPAAESELVTPATAARAYITEHSLAPHYLIGEALKEDFRNLPSGDKPAVVIGDAGEAFTYEALNV